MAPILPLLFLWLPLGGALSVHLYGSHCVVLMAPTRGRCIIVFLWLPLGGAVSMLLYGSCSPCVVPMAPIGGAVSMRLYGSRSVLFLWLPLGGALSVCFYGPH